MGDNCGVVYYHGLTFIQAWINDYIHCEVCEDITCPSANINGTTVEMWEWIINIIPHFTGYVIRYMLLWLLDVKQSLAYGI